MTMTVSEMTYNVSSKTLNPTVPYDDDGFHCRRRHH